MSGAALIGKKLGGRYYVTDKLGEGGIGETYLAIDQGQPGNYRCVIKRLKPQNTNQTTIGWLQQSFKCNYILLLEDWFCLVLILLM